MQAAGAAQRVAAAGPPAAPAYWLRTALLVLSVLFPTAYRVERGVLLSVGFAAMMLVALHQGRLAVHRTLLSWTVACGAAGAIWMVWGGLNGAPGVPRIVTVYVLWPLVFTLALGAFATRRSQWWAFRGLLLAELLIASYAVTFILYTAGLAPAWTYLPLDLDQSISLSEGSIEISFYSLNSLLFLVPFSTAAVLVWRFESMAAGAFTIGATVLGILIALISGRRALQLVVVLAPFVTAGLLLFAKPDMRRRGLVRVGWLIALGAAGVFIAALSLLVVLKVDFGLLWRAFSEGFVASEDLALNPRALQFSVLMDEWSRQPFFGAGHGATAVGSLRSSQQPWAYELSYVALLFQVGIAGFAVYLSAVAWLYLRAVRIIAQDAGAAQLMIPALVGTTSFLLGNATNPYLAAFDYLWTLFLPLAVINGCMLARRPDAGTT